MDFIWYLAFSKHWLLAVEIIIEMSGFMELNKIFLWKHNHLLTFFFIFVLVSFLPLLTYQVPCKPSYASFVAELPCSVLPQIWTDGQIFLSDLIILEVGSIWTLNSPIFISYANALSILLFL